MAVTKGDYFNAATPKPAPPSLPPQGSPRAAEERARRAQASRGGGRLPPQGSARQAEERARRKTAKPNFVFDLGPQLKYTPNTVYKSMDTARKEYLADAMAKEAAKKAVQGPSIFGPGERIGQAQTVGKMKGAVDLSSKQTGLSVPRAPYGPQYTVEFLARQYGINPDIIRSRPQLYGLVARRDGTYTPLDPKGKLVFLGEVVSTTGGATGSSPAAVEHANIQAKRNVVLSLEEAKATIYGWSPQKIAAFQARYGLTGKDKRGRDLPSIPGIVDAKTYTKWSTGVVQAGQSFTMGGWASPGYVQAARAGGEQPRPFTPEEYLDATHGIKGKGPGATGSEGGGTSGGGRRRGRGGRSGGGGGGGGGGTAKQITLTSRTEVQRYLDDMLSDRLGRKATESEVSLFTKKLNAAERANPRVGTMSGGTPVVSGGVDAAQVLINEFNKTSLGVEAATRTAGVDYFQAAMQMLGV